MPRDGEERKIECELVLAYCEGDESVGLHSGYAVAGLQVGERFLTIDEMRVVGGGMPTRYVFAFDDEGGKALTRMADEASSSAHEEE